MVSKPKRLTLVLVTMVLLAGRSLAQQPSTTDTRESEPPNGSIRGTVVNENGQPMAGASVMARLNSLTSSMRSVTTDNEGNFQVANLDRGLYSVSASSPAHVMRPGGRDEPPPFYRIGDTVRLELVRGGIITGTVTNATNDPVIAVRVVALRVRDEEGQPVKGMQGALVGGSTDDRGIYRVFGLLPGTYVVMAGGSSGFSPFQLNPYEMDVPTYAPSSTRDNALEVSVRSGEESNVDIRYRGEPGRVVSGTVKGAVGPTFSNITMTPANIGTGNFASAVQPPGARGFAFNGVADGAYELVATQTVTALTSQFPETGFSEPFRITVKGADVTGIELIPKPMAAINGKIVLEPSNLEECKGKRRPLLVETVVTLQRNKKTPESDSFSDGRAFFRTASPERDGTITFRNLTGGQYSFAPRFFGRYWYLQSITLTNPALATARTAPTKIDTTKNWTTLKAGDRLTGLTITLAEGAASIRGRVEIPEATKMSDIDLYVVPAEKEKAEDVLRYFVAEVAADGTFSADNLPPGRYWLLTQRRETFGRFTTPKLQLPDASETRSKVRRAAATHKEIELKPCQNVTGHRLRFDP